MATASPYAMLSCTLCQRWESIRILECQHKVCLNCLKDDAKCPKCNAPLDADFEPFNLSAIEEEFKSFFSESVTSYCSSGDGAEASYRCEECCENLCTSCLSAHQRVRLTKDHSILPLSPPPFKSDSTLHRRLRDEIDGFEQAILQVQKTADCIQRRAVAVSNDVHGKACHFIGLIEDRERELLRQIDNIRNCKVDTLYKQLDSLKALHSHRKYQLSELERGADIDLSFVTYPTEPYEDDIITFAPPDVHLFEIEQKLGRVSSSACATLCYASGDGCRCAVVAKVAVFFIHAVDHNGQNRTGGGDPFTVVVKNATESQVLPSQIVDRLNGNYVVSYTPSVEGICRIYVTLRGRSIKNSPFTVTVRSSRNYASISRAKCIFSQEGDAEGQLSRPWGVCTNKDGYVIVADRSNNRIQIFDSEGKFRKAFGSLGSRPGQLDRPAGVTCNSRNEIIVADKDNHRIQVFDQNGRWLNGWGEKGSKSGQFNYPWDVAVNEKAVIAVSDTRNHRIQLFSMDGRFITKYGSDSTIGAWRHFDSPRGVSFLPNGHLVVTEFNSHCLLIIKEDLSGAHVHGQEGSGAGQLLRPQGVACDFEGNIIVADSRNHRIQVFNTSGNLIARWGTFGHESGQFDRPSGVCIGPDGTIYVVDFGNNRIQAF